MGSWGSVGAWVNSDDHQVETAFDATKWFLQATGAEIEKLARSGWGQDYESDEIARFCSHSDEEVNKVLDIAHGFECTVFIDSAMAWLRLARPLLARKLEEDKDVLIS